MATVSHKYIRTAPRKIRVILDAIRGLPAEAAEQRLQAMPRQSARDVYAALHGAIASAKSQGLAVEGLMVAQAYCNEGPRLKRRVMHSRGRARQIQKQLSHIHLTVSAKNPAVPTAATTPKLSQAEEPKKEQ